MIRDPSAPQARRGRAATALRGTLTIAKRVPRSNAKHLRLAAHHHLR
jgi:hypothetical protein